MNPGTRVEWACDVIGCTVHRHRGMVSPITHMDAVKFGLTADFELSGLCVAVVLDDRPGVLQFLPVAELVAIR